MTPDAFHPREALASMRTYFAGPHEEPIELTDTQMERIFFDYDGTPRERLSLSQMTEDQRTAFGRWATSVGVTRTAGDEAETQLQNDMSKLRDGVQDADRFIYQHG